MKEYRREFEELGLVICANSECPNEATPTGHRVRRMRCAQCKTTVYCSRSCQKQDWKRNHRKECESLLDEGLLRLGWTKPDLQFRTWVREKYYTPPVGGKWDD
ncbi:hypothetical protein D9758_016701 [Tetrapyrgos nigripes]|uniref:MYND-type domain-containing protein n=1 Tax=Tetrapyrgos nigripes TaxID=182062 RepID=A0A8H5FGF2_9AGAR|nr:hypothetical protein D9758_016701 [Tetrapyrgos nigripes]